MASFPAFRPHGFALFLAPSEDRKKGRPGFPDRLAASTPLPERKRQGCMNGQWRFPARREMFTFSMEWRHAKSRGRLNDFKGSVIVCGCFITTVLWKYSLFLRFSPWRDSRLRPFSGYPFGTSRKKASTIFYNTAKRKKSVFSPYYEDETVTFHGSAKEKTFPASLPSKNTGTAHLSLVSSKDFVPIEALITASFKTDCP